MKGRFLTFCIDLEAFDLINECCSGKMSRDEMYRISLQGLDLLCGILNEFSTKVTFFVSYDIAMLFPEKVGLLANNGHEIALHSVLQDHDGRERLESLKKQKLIVEDAIKGKIFGHRSHKFLPVPLIELREAGLTYDNSLHPTYVPGRYCNIFSRRNIYKERDILRVPVTVTPWLRFPLSWIWFRIFGLTYMKLCSSFTYLMQDYINIYFHTWDFENITYSPLRWPHRLLIHNTGNRTISNFKRFLDWVRRENITVLTMSGYLQNQYQR